MAKDIYVVLPHSLGRDEARRRVNEVIEKGRGNFAQGAVSATVAWTDYHADVSVGALGQNVMAKVDVEAEEVRIRVALPWLLASLSTKIADRLKKVGGGALQIGHDPKA